jgi:hypothetical protein
VKVSLIIGIALAAAGSAWAQGLRSVDDETWALGGLQLRLGDVVTENQAPGNCQRIGKRHLQCKVKPPEGTVFSGRAQSILFNICANKLVSIGLVFSVKEHDLAKALLSIFGPSTVASSGFQYYRAGDRNEVILMGDGLIRYGTKTTPKSRPTHCGD